MSLTSQETGGFVLVILVVAIATFLIGGAVGHSSAEAIWKERILSDEWVAHVRSETQVKQSRPE